MSTINDEITINSTPAKAFEALTTQAGYRAWWNKLAEVPANVGGEARLEFNKEGQIIKMRFRIDAQVYNERVKWTCTGHDMPSWIGTTLDWKLRSNGSQVVVALEHAGWKEAAPEPVKQGWKHFLGSLKTYLEGGAGQPW